MGAIGYVLISSFLIEENILALVIYTPPFATKNILTFDFFGAQMNDVLMMFLSCVQITVNIHASLTYVFTSVGLQSAPSMDIIYAIFGSLVSLTTVLHFANFRDHLYIVFFYVRN